MRVSQLGVMTAIAFIGVFTFLLEGCGDEPGCGTLGCGNGDKTVSDTGGSTPQGSRSGTANTGGSGAQHGTGGAAGASRGILETGGTTALHEVGGARTNTGGNRNAGGGTASQTGGEGSSSSCFPDGKELTLGAHTVFEVTWPSTLGTASGTGKFHTWSLSKVTPSGDTIAGTYQSCGTSIPETTLTAVTGGGKLLVEVPMSLWDLDPPMKFALKGTLSAGWGPGSSIVSEGDPAVIGLSLADAAGAWPATYAAVSPVDVEKDGKPGMTAIPKSGGGFVNPPLSIMGPLGPRADRVYLANRTEVKLEGEFTSCTEHSGKATPTFLDTHVVGCHVAGGAECNTTQAKFADDNRMLYTPKPGTYTAKIVPDTATCADVRTALPM